MSWPGESHRHGMAAKGVATVEPSTYIKYGYSQYREPEMPIFELDTHDVPLVANMMENPEYFREKKGKTYRILWLTLLEYELALRRGWNFKYSLDDIKERISKSHLEKLKEKMQRETFAMPWLEYRLTRSDESDFGQEGHHRVIAASELGMDKVPVFIIYPSDTKDFIKVEPIMSRLFRKELTLEAEGIRGKPFKWKSQAELEHLERWEEAKRREREGMPRGRQPTAYSEEQLRQFEEERKREVRPIPIKRKVKVVKTEEPLTIEHFL